MAWDAIFPSSHLSVEDREEIARIVDQALRRRVAEEQVENVYGTLQTDVSVTGVGVSTSFNERPSDIVPRSEFPKRSGEGVIIEDSATKRIRPTRERVRLISPVLKAGSRRWRFSGREGEFGAKIKDRIGVANILLGRTAVPMVDGIEMDVEIHTVEEKRGGVWNVLERVVVKIHRVIPPHRQIEMPLTSPKRRVPPKKGKAESKEKGSSKSTRATKK